MLFDFALAIAPVFSPMGHASAVLEVAALITADDEIEASTFISTVPHTEMPTLVDDRTHHGRPALRCIRTDSADEEARVFDMRRVLAGRMASRRELALSIERAMTDAELAQPISVPDAEPAPRRA